MLNYRYTRKWEFFQLSAYIFERGEGYEEKSRKVIGGVFDVYCSADLCSSIAGTGKGDK